jgi:hypothetical protein
MPDPLAVESRRIARWRIFGLASFLAIDCNLSMALRLSLRAIPPIISSLSVSFAAPSYSSISALRPSCVLTRERFETADR